MKGLAFGALVAGTLVLGGCNSKNDFYDAPKPIDKMSAEELCTFYDHYRSNPELSPDAKATATRQMRAKGCPMT